MGATGPLPPRHWWARPAHHCRGVRQRHQADDRDVPGPFQQRQALAGRADDSPLVRRAGGRSSQPVPRVNGFPAPPRPASRPRGPWSPQSEQHNPPHAEPHTAPTGSRISVLGNRRTVAGLALGNARLLPGAEGLRTTQRHHRAARRHPASVGNRGDSAGSSTTPPATSAGDKTFRLLDDRGHRLMDRQSGRGEAGPERVVVRDAEAEGPGGHGEAGAEHGVDVEVAAVVELE